LLGNAQIAAGDSAAAVRSFEQARSLATSDSKMDSKQRATIEANLAAAYVSAGDIDKAQALLPDIKQLDPSNNVAQSRISNYYAGKADAAQKSGDYATAAGLWEKAGAAGGQYAPWMYANEAFAYMQGSKPDWKSAKAAADKALALKPDDAQANLAEGVALAGSGKKAEAIQYLQKADASAKAAGETSVASQAEQFLKQLGASK
jgi:tetratricopeptide (TPR) repeat protein